MQIATRAECVINQVDFTRISNTIKHFAKNPERNGYEGTGLFSFHHDERCGLVPQDKFALPCLVAFHDRAFKDHVRMVYMAPNGSTLPVTVA